MRGLFPPSAGFAVLHKCYVRLCLLLVWNNLLLSGKSKSCSASKSTGPDCVQGQCSGAWQVHESPYKRILSFCHPGLVCCGSMQPPGSIVPVHPRSIAAFSMDFRAQAALYSTLPLKYFNCLLILFSQTQAGCSSVPGLEEACCAPWLSPSSSLLPSLAVLSRGLALPAAPEPSVSSLARASSGCAGREPSLADCSGCISFQMNSDLPS